MINQIKDMQEKLKFLGFVDPMYYTNEKNFITGEYFNYDTIQALKHFQQAKGLKADGIYRPETALALSKDYLLALNSDFNVTVDEFLENAKIIAKENKENNFSYGDASCFPGAYPFEKLTSCDRYVTQVLYRSGFKNCGNRGFNTLKDYLEQIKAQKIYRKDELKKGDIVFVIGHVFILGNKISETEYERYDAGSTARIQLTGKYSKYASQPFIENIDLFIYGYRLPFK